MPSRWDSATCGWRRRVFHYPPPTLMSRNFRLPRAIELRPLSLTPLKMRKVELTSKKPTIEFPLRSQGRNKHRPPTHDNRRPHHPCWPPQILLDQHPHARRLLAPGAVHPGGVLLSTNHTFIQESYP